MRGWKWVSALVLAYGVAVLLGFELFTRARRPPAGTRRVILIRHGEKEGTKGNWGNGLSYAGKMRAQCLAKLYGGLGVTNLFAFTNKPTTRPFDTLAPLSAELGIEIDTQFKRGQMKELADYILALPPKSLSVVCWEHDRIHTIAHALGVTWDDMPEDLMHFKSEFWDKQWSIYFDDTGAGGKPVNIMQEQEHCTYGGVYFDFLMYYWYGAGGASLPHCVGNAPPSRTDLHAGPATSRGPVCLLMRLARRAVPPFSPQPHAYMHVQHVT